ncbi:unnamed protein product [Gongylonema pulchrum]|uniref:RGS domain-containing protein n=1 Tax=Gongylonema pulchrum TaxID=637853 RepID=A0A183D3S6_9BILA|nr:unnamed protein product [Gongylonema pulchrum]
MIDERSWELYLKLYRYFNLFEHFHTYEEWEKYDAAVRSVFRNGAEESSEETSPMRNTETDEQPLSNESVLKNALQMVCDVHVAFTILSDCNVEENDTQEQQAHFVGIIVVEPSVQILLKMSSPHRYAELYYLTYLKSGGDCAWLSTAYFAQFLASSFVVDGFVHTCKVSSLCGRTHTSKHLKCFFVPRQGRGIN